MSESEPAYWDEQAPTFDNEADHGLRGVSIRAAWRRLLRQHLPTAPADIVDLGCGTGSLSVLLAEEGYSVRGLDFSPDMIAAAGHKATAAHRDIEFQVGDASSPPYEPSSYDVVLARHVLWALPDPAAALARWCRLLRRDGRLVLIEGHWNTGAGLTSKECMRIVGQHRTNAEVTALDNIDLWGRPIDDERYILTSLS
jgi:ubiquinone/menaquinone biosynthesis C-methylase UbiE